DIVGLIAVVTAPGNVSTPDATGCAGMFICGSGFGGSGVWSLGVFSTGTVTFALSGISALRGGSGVLLPPPPPPPPGPGDTVQMMSRGIRLALAFGAWIAGIVTTNRIASAIARWVTNETLKAFPRRAAPG